MLLSEVLARASRAFHMAYQLGLLEAGRDRTISSKKARLARDRNAWRVGLVNYFAGAVLMPYDGILSAAQTARYDIEVLTHVRRSSSRPATGSPRCSGRAPRACRSISCASTSPATSPSASRRRFPFLALRRLVPALGRARSVPHPRVAPHPDARLPDGAAFFCIARAVPKESGGKRPPHSQLAIGIGCDIAQAREVVYADGHDLERADAATEIGLGRRLSSAKTAASAPSRPCNTASCSTSA